MSNKGAAFATIIVIVCVVVITMLTNREEPCKENIPKESTKKSEMIGHYGKSAEVELLKISDNSWRLENYNDFPVTIRQVKISYDGVIEQGEITQSVWRINSKSNCVLNLSTPTKNGFYVYDGYGALSGWLRPDKEPYFTKTDQ